MLNPRASFWTVPQAGVDGRVAVKRVQVLAATPIIPTVKPSPGAFRRKLTPTPSMPGAVAGVSSRTHTVRVLPRRSRPPTQGLIATERAKGVSTGFWFTPRDPAVGEPVV